MKNKMLNFNKKWHLRFAISGICNFRCIYCNRFGNSRHIKNMPINEVEEILKAAYANGIVRVHYTGGEPFIRKDMIDIFKIAKNIGYKDQIVTTNGYSLHKIIDKCIENGLNRVIVSLDSLSKERNKFITGRNFLDDTLYSIESAANSLKTQTKISCVTMKSTLKELPDIIDYVRRINIKGQGQVILKLNQFHPDNEAQLYKDGQIFFKDEFVEESEILAALSKIGKLKKLKIGDVSGNNPSYRYYLVENIGVIVGILAMMSWNFPCGRCYKLRVQPSGYVMTCKNYKKSPSLRGLAYEEKKKIIYNWMYNREFIIDKEKPNRVHYYEQLGEERWGKVGSPKKKDFFYDLLKKDKNE